MMISMTSIMSPVIAHQFQHSEARSEVPASARRGALPVLASIQGRDISKNPVERYTVASILLSNIRRKDRHIHMEAISQAELA